MQPLHFLPMWSLARGLLILGLAIPVLAQVDVRIFTFNSAPFEEVILSNARWVPPRIEAGFLRITNGPGGIFLKPLVTGTLAKAFGISTKVRFPDGPVSFGIHFVPQDLWNRPTLSVSHEVVVARNTAGMSFSFERSGNNMEIRLREYGVLRSSANVATAGVNTWAALEITLDESGRATVRLNGESIVDQVQLAFMPMQGRLLLTSDYAIDVGRIDSTLTAVDGPLMQRVFTTPTTIQVIPGALMKTIDPASLMMKVDGSLVPRSAISLGTTSINYAHYRRFEPQSRHTVDVWYETFGSTYRGHHQRELAIIPHYTVVPGDITRLVSVEPQGITTNLGPVRIVFTKPTTNPPPTASDIKVTVNGSPKPFQLAETTTTIEVTVELPELCPGEYNYLIEWRDPGDNTAYLEKISFEYTGELTATSLNASGAVEAIFPEGEYYCYLKSPGDNGALPIALALLLASGLESVELGRFATSNLTVRPLLDANGARAMISLSGMQHLRVEDAPDGSVLEFQQVSLSCGKTLAIGQNEDGMKLHRGSGRLQFSLDLFDWENAGPVFEPSISRTNRSLFFREAK